MITSPPCTCKIRYSDGDEVENRIAAVLDAAVDVTSSSLELAAAIRDWPTLVHFSPDRRNLLIPIRDLLTGRILELGAGCGAITRFLGETGSEVIAIEGSPRRAASARNRCRDLTNVRIVNENFVGWNGTGCFNAVVAIGFLEHANVYSGSPNPVADTLNHIAEVVAPGGALILAIENQLGLKYIAGAVEDHVGEPYFGVNDLYDRTTPITFGKAQLERVLRQAGFGSLEFYYPFPDYKLPSIVVRSAAVHSPGLDLAAILRGVLRQRTETGESAFDAASAFAVLCRNGLLEDLANSFLVVARREPESDRERPLLYLFSTDRHAHFQKITTFQETKTGIVVHRAPLNDAAPPPESIYRRELRDEPYVKYPQWWNGLSTVVRKNGWTIHDVVVWARPWVCFLQDSCLDLQAGVMPPNFVDCTPFNVGVDDAGRFHPFDLEFVSNTPVHLDFVVFRGLWQSFAKLNRCARPDASVPKTTLDVVTSVMADCGFSLDSDRLQSLVLKEAELQSTVRRLNLGSVVTAFATERLPFSKDLLRRPDGPSYACRVYWRSGQEGYDESRSSSVSLNVTPVMQRLDLVIPPMRLLSGLRLDLADRTGIIEVAAITLNDLRGHEIRHWSPGELAVGASNGMRCFTTPGSPDDLTVFLFTNDPNIELPVDPTSAIACLNGGLLRVICRWPAEYAAIERVLSDITQTCSIGEHSRNVRESLDALGERLRAIHETLSDRIKAIDEQLISDQEKYVALQAALAQIAAAQDTMMQYVKQPWWKRNP
jgi:SAM-dependent methyltransferase